MSKKPVFKKHNLNLINPPPAIGVDGARIKISSKDVADVYFYQVANRTPERIDANGVATLRMNFKQIASFKKLIDFMLKDQKYKETK